jgi:hypothetical protein
VEDFRLAKRRNLPKRADSAAADPFALLYPNVTAWVQDGWIEVGRDDFSRSFVRVLDIGGLVWEGETAYPTIHAAFLALDNAIADWIKENG